MAILNRVSAGIMRQFVSWHTACNFNDVIQKFKNLKCLITGTSTLVTKQFFTSVKDRHLLFANIFYASISEERGGDFIKVHSAHVA